MWVFGRIQAECRIHTKNIANPNDWAVEHNFTSNLSWATCSSLYLIWNLCTSFRLLGANSFCCFNSQGFLYNFGTAWRFFMKIVNHISCCHMELIDVCFWYIFRICVQWQKFSNRLYSMKNIKPNPLRFSVVVDFFHS